MTIRIIAAAAAAIAALSANAGVYKCEQSGQVVYSDKPCAKAKVVDTTNAKPPTRKDAVDAQLRSLNDRSVILQQELQETREQRERAECQRIIRDHNWTTKTASKYQNDEWWQNRAQDSTDDLQKRCSKYLIPGGAAGR